MTQASVACHRDVGPHANTNNSSTTATAFENTKKSRPETRGRNLLEQSGFLGQL